MNCNPFTNGHLFLIDTCAKLVDMLIIFVVEEDRSVFPFEDRIKLVREGTREYRNVTVIPSGSYVLSYDTMPLYFQKSEKKDAKIDASMDIELFARFIAPAFNISVRFAGEEPFDKVTKQYNEQMADILPEFGIDFKTIPRKANRTTGVISASKVRQFLENNNWKSMKEMVPEITYEYLKSMRIKR